MNRDLFLLAACVALPGLAALGVMSVRAERERAQAQASLGALHALTGGAQELASLRATVPTWVQGATPAGGLTQSVTATLEKCGLRANVLENLSADAEPDRSGSASSGGGGVSRGAAAAVHRRGASLVLTNLTLPQLGSFLAAWREREPRWIVAKIDLAPAQRKAQSNAGGDLPVRAVLGLEYMSVVPGVGP